MGLNITHAMTNFQFESKENLRNTAKDILQKHGASENSIQKIIEQPVFSSVNLYPNPQLAIIKASSQITLNNSLKETLKYLKSHSNNKNNKKPILGELWEEIEGKEISYEGELIDFEIDMSAKNIFAAA